MNFLYTSTVQEIFSLIAKAWRSGVSFQRGLISTSVVLATIAGIVAALSNLPSVNEEIVVGLAASLGGMALGVISFVLLRQGVIVQAERESRVEAAEQRVDSHPNEPQAAWDLGQIKLEAYIGRNLNALRCVFWLTIAIIVAGFVLIGIAVTNAYSHPTEESASLLTGISGVVVNFIGATILVFYRSTISEAKDYVTVLERINAVGMAVQILDSLQDDEGKLRQNTMAEIATGLLKMYSPNS